MFFQPAFYATYAYTSIDEKTIFSGANIGEQLPLLPLPILQKNVNQSVFMSFYQKGVQKYKKKRLSFLKSKKVKIEKKTLSFVLRLLNNQFLNIKLRSIKQMYMKQQKEKNMIFFGIRAVIEAIEFRVKKLIKSFYVVKWVAI